MPDWVATPKHVKSKTVFLGKFAREFRLRTIGARLVRDAICDTSCVDGVDGCNWCQTDHRMT
jgi:hypothetical protein